MKVGDRNDMMIALSLGRCKPFLMMPSCDCRVSVATGTSKSSHFRYAPEATVSHRNAVCRDWPVPEVAAMCEN
jgi:hypothetical protein